MNLLPFFHPAESNTFEITSVENYWARIRKSIGKLSPAMPLLSSPYHPTLLFDFPPELDFHSPDFPDYMHYGIHPAFAALLRESANRPDILMVQDGVGYRAPIPRREDLFDVNFRVFAEIRRACDDAGIHCWSNVESFDFSENEEKLLPRYYNGGFDGERGFVQQLESVFRFSERILTLSLTGFFAPSGVEPALGGAAALEQAQNYETYRKHPIRDYENLAAGKSYSITPEPSPCFQTARREN